MCLNSVKVCSKNLQCCCSDPTSSHSTFLKNEVAHFLLPVGLCPSICCFQQIREAEQTAWLQIFEVPCSDPLNKAHLYNCSLPLKVRKKKKKEQDVYEARRAVLNFRSPAVGNPCKPWLLTASSMSMCFKHTGSTSVPNWKTFSMAHRICLFEAISETKLRIECPPCYEYKHYQMLVLAVCRLLLGSPPGGTASDLRHGVDVTLRHI